MRHSNMPQWNTPSVRDAFNSYPLTADLCTTYPRQPPEKAELSVNEQRRMRILLFMSCNLTRLESAQVYKLRVLCTLCKCLLCHFVQVYFVIHSLQTLKIQSDRRQLEKIILYSFNTLKSDAHLNNMRVQNFSTYLTESTVHVHYKYQQIQYRLLKYAYLL